MSKKIFLLLFTFFVFTGHALAEEVTVEGYGNDREAALSDARRIAVERVVGAYVEGKTVVEAMAVELDEIYTRADGFSKVVGVLEENFSGSVYRVKAIIDVDTNPQNDFMSNLQMIARLRDPKIAVIALRNGDYGFHEVNAETIINESLINLGFTNVLNVSQVTSMYDSKTLQNIYHGIQVADLSSNYGADMVIIGHSTVKAEKIKIPDYKGGYKEVALNSGVASFAMKIVNPYNGRILDTFLAEGKVMGIDRAEAERESLRAASLNAAKMIEEKLKKLSARTLTTTSVKNK